MNEKSDNPAEQPPETALRDVVCPFCALHCDDLSLPLRNRRPQTNGLGCSRARAGFERALNIEVTRPLLQGRETDWKTALASARRLLESSSLPLFHGLIGDLGDTRAALRLAAHFGGVIDHLHGDAVARNLAVYQDSGWQITSLGEARNRADLVVLIGDAIDATLPRLREKLFDVDARLHAARPPRLLELGEHRLDTLNQTRVLLGGRPLPEPYSGAVQLYRLLQDSRYPVFVVGPLADPRAELILRAVVELVRDINETGRAALLTLGNGHGDVTAQLASAWHNGFGIRTSFARGYPVQDLLRHAGDRLSNSGEADLVVWISSLSEQPPPPSGPPHIVIGHPATQFEDQPPDVFLPVAVPGVHRQGFMHRADGLRMLPLHPLVESELPASNDLCRQLLASSEDA